MRITKTIREYIEREVKAKVTPKYAAEKIESDRQKKALSEFLDACQQAAVDAYNAYFDEHFSDISSFCEDCRRGPVYVREVREPQARLKNAHCISSIHRWIRRCDTEIEETVDRIILELELGGDKARLMEMLEAVGKE